MINIIILIIILLIIFTPLMPYRFSKDTHKLNNSNYDYLKVSFSLLPEIRVLEGKDKINKFCLENNIKYVNSNFLDLTGSNPLKELTTFKKGIPQYFTFYLCGKFEILQDGKVSFNIKKWYPVDNKYVYLMDTIFWENKYRTIYIITLIGVVTIYIFFIIKKYIKYKR